MTAPALVGDVTVNFPQSIASGFGNFANFQGRASRSEFWFWALFSWIVAAVVAGFDIDWLTSVIPLIFLLPSLSVGVRRLHDTGSSGASLLLGLIPVVGPFILLAKFVQAGTPGKNQYGNNPLGVYGSDYYQSQQYLPTMGQRAALPAPSTFPGYGFNFGHDAAAEPVPVRAATDEWSQQFSRLQAHAPLPVAEVPDVYKKHFFTEEELRQLRAGRSQAVLLTDDATGDFYLATVTWTGSTFTEVPLNL